MGPGKRFTEEPKSSADAFRLNERGSQIQQLAIKLPRSAAQKKKYIQLRSRKTEL